jgi:two-component system, LytTR family, response regulator
MAKSGRDRDGAGHDSRRDPSAMSVEKISALIIDDEPLGRDFVRLMLRAHPDIHVVGECADGEKALAAIKRLAPQLVLLDVKMPRLDGVGVLRKLPAENRPLIVFVTAHEAYALTAFEGQVFDYLLKPFDQERFDLVMRRVRARLEEIQAAKLGQSVRHLLQTGGPAAKPVLDRVVVRESGRMFFVEVGEIVWLEASGNYVALHVAAGKTHLVHETMNALEAKLDAKTFVRIHRSTMVRVDQIKELHPHFNGEYVVTLKDGARVKLSRGYLEKARAALGLS